MPRVKIGPALPGREKSPSRSPSCAISTSGICGSAGTLCLADDHLLTCLAIFCFGFSPTDFRRIISAIWMASASACSTTRGLPRKRDGVPRTWAGALPRLGPAPCWAVNGTAGCIGWRCSPMALLGTARPIPACRRSPWRSPAPAGTARSSSACAISRRKGPPHEDRTSECVRCAIYTRVSTDQGLEQDFNSLDAQYDASQAYIRSQAHAGWTLLRAKYDDGGFSGGNTIDRPCSSSSTTSGPARST